MSFVLSCKPEMRTDAAEARRAAAREDLCRFIAACYYEPEQAFEDEGMFEALLRAASELGAELAAPARKLGEAFRASQVEDLLLDYTRLFLGPSTILAKPYGSVWLEGEGTLMGETTVDVLAIYREAGFDIDDAFQELPDHVAVELEFLSLLIFREKEARTSGDAGKLAAVAALQQRFLVRHLGAWVNTFTAAVASGAQCEFYRELAGLTERFVRQQALRIADA